MSENLRMLGEYSAAMARGDTEAVYGCFSPEFVSHVADRVNCQAGLGLRPTA